MFKIEVELRNFGPPQTVLQNERRIEEFSHLDLIKAAITVGHSRWEDAVMFGVTSIFDALRRVFMIKTALVVVDGRLQSTLLYRNADPTDKAQMTSCIGSTVCGLLAGRIAKVPWLMSLKVYELTLHPSFIQEMRRRPDYVGHTVDRDWFVFEAKGRTTDNLTDILRKAKEQSSAIATIGRAPVVCGLASVAYVGPDEQVRAIWDDPPPQVAGPDDTNLNLSDAQYFEAYYRPILRLIETVPAEFASDYGRVAYLPSIDVYLGLQEEVRTSLRLRRFDNVQDFAKRHLPIRQNNIMGSGGEVLFPDGVIVQAGATWNAIFAADNPRERTK